MAKMISLFTKENFELSRTQESTLEGKAKKNGFFFSPRTIRTQQITTLKQSAQQLLNAYKNNHQDIEEKKRKLIDYVSKIKIDISKEWNRKKSNLMINLETVSAIANTEPGQEKLLLNQLRADQNTYNQLMFKTLLEEFENEGSIQEKLSERKQNLS